MSHIPIHDVSARAKTRAGRTYQVEALAPFAAREALALWQFQRRGWLARRGLYGPAAAELELAEGLPALELEQPIAPGAPAPAPTPRVARGAPAAACPEQLSWALNLSEPDSPASDAFAISTDALPWPCRIVGAQFLQFPTTSGAPHWNLYVTDQAVSGVWAPVGTPLLLPRGVRGSGLTDLLAGGRNLGAVVPPLNSHAPADTESHQGQTYASALLGAVIRDAGKFLTFAAWPDTPSTLPSMSLVLTVQQCDIPDLSTQLRTLPAPRIAAPRAPAPTPAPAAAAPAAAALPPPTERLARVTDAGAGQPIMRLITPIGTTTAQWLIYYPQTGMAQMAPTLPAASTAPQFRITDTLVSAFNLPPPPPETRRRRT